MKVRSFHLGKALRISDEIDKTDKIIKAKELVLFLDYPLITAPWGSVEHIGETSYSSDFHDCFVWLEFCNRADSEDFIKKYEEIFGIRCGDNHK